MINIILNFPRKLLATVFYYIGTVFMTAGILLKVLAYNLGDKRETPPTISLSEEEYESILDELENLKNTQKSKEDIKNDEEIH